MTTAPSAANPQVNVPQMCQTHQRLLVTQLRYGPHDPWQALLIVSQIALLQGSLADPKVYQEIEGSLENVSRIGCLACRKPDLFGTLVDVVQKSLHRKNRHLKLIKELGEKWVRAGATVAAPTTPMTPTPTPTPKEDPPGGLPNA